MVDSGKVLVAGAGGFIGHHLVKRLKRDGCWIRAADVKEPEYESTAVEERAMNWVLWVVGALPASVLLAGESFQQLV